MRPLRLSSFNIRMETSEPDPGVRRSVSADIQRAPIDNWSNRKSDVIKSILASDADIIGLQEVLPDQLRCLTDALHPHGYQHVGLGRGEDGDDEASPIFFKGEVFDLVHHDQRWLSATPSVPGSMLDGAGCPRVVTAALLKTKSSGQHLCAFCCHLDHHGMERAAWPFSRGLHIQAAQAEILLKEVDLFCGRLAAGCTHAVRVILGDFNSWRGAGAHQVLCQHGYKDASSASGTDSRPTFTGFRSGNIIARLVERWNSVQIDWIFAGGPAVLSNYALGSGSYLASDGKLRNLSDHVMILADVSLQAGELP
ncbi:unnamed protein product [Symbiodinium sp. CCMP2592]|nr:unnamed protein product [Symbiodinium sp. CCMP2592]